MPRGGRRSTTWGPGQGGRPPAIPADVRALFRLYTPEALKALRDALKSKKERVAAATVILNRGWGLPAQTINADLRTELLIRIEQMPAEERVQRAAHLVSQVGRLTSPTIDADAAD